MALHKLRRPESTPSEFWAQLTASEAMALIGDGWKLSPRNNYKEHHFLDYIQRGEGGKSCCYFTNVGKHHPTHKSLQKPIK